MNLQRKDSNKPTTKGNNVPKKPSPSERGRPEKKTK